MSDGWITISKQAKIPIDAADRVVSAFAYRDYALIITERGFMYKVFNEFLDETVHAISAGKLRETAIVPDPELVKAVTKTIVKYLQHPFGDFKE